MKYKSIESGVIRYAVIKSSFNQIGEETTELYALFSDRADCLSFSAHLNKSRTKGKRLLDQYYPVIIKEKTCEMVVLNNL